jgi:hypothetical protein
VGRILPAEPADEIIKLFSAFLQADLVNRISMVDQLPGEVVTPPGCGHTASCSGLWWRLVNNVDGTADQALIIPLLFKIGL